ncbi:hypothetical protein WJU16_03380 [Chitinophaga pollutisoli]|uniref:Uncharacterized protein n=1 Tax=Chitinophaga pollutisoli TaxID=3133966 RepID=A0ABZ2YRB1_9BACT
MEKLFERNNFGLQPFVDEDGQDTYFAYTDKLLALNVLIEFYTAVTDDTEENYEEETVVSAITYTENRSYSFALFHSTNVIGPLILYRIVADAIHFLEQSSKATLLEDLEEISTGGTTSDVMDNEADRKRVYDSDVWKFTSVLDLIKEKR